MKNNMLLTQLGIEFDNYCHEEMKNLLEREPDLFKGLTEKEIQIVDNILEKVVSTLGNNIASFLNKLE